MGEKVELSTGTVVAALAVVLIAAGVGYFLLSEEPEPSTELDMFAQCLSENGATMYGLETCPHCQDQKDMFGSSFKFVDHVECSRQKSVCSRKGVTSVPLWIINGKRMGGVQSLQKLSEVTGCDLPRG